MWGTIFQRQQPWCLMAAQAIRELYESSGERPNVGDWGCGHGQFSLHALISGGNPYGIELHKAAAEDAIETIFKAKKHLPKSLKLKGIKTKNLYHVLQGSVSEPTSNFMTRQNHINVCFNVLHHLIPSDIDLLLRKMFENTVQGGFVIFCSDTPVLSESQCRDYHRQGLAQKLKYPGFGVYNTSQYLFTEDMSKGKKEDVNGEDPRERNKHRSISRPEKAEKLDLKAGHTYAGSYPPVYGIDTEGKMFTDAGIIIEIDETNMGGPADFLGGSKGYHYTNRHYLFNFFDYTSLSRVLKDAKFTVVNGGYTHRESSVLFPHDGDRDSRCDKVVLVAQKK